ncbi:MAG: CoA-binding protein [Syntrophales bacterium]|nr:CoA-binding protein [Syntrophales bacterium]
MENSIFEYIFNPQSVAIIGASPHDLATIGHLKTKIREKLCLVNPKHKEILGRKCYPSVLDIPQDIDYAIIGVGAERVPATIEDCIKKGVKVAQIFTAGFSETGIPERIALEEKIKTLAHGRIRLIGPNCFGVYCPRSGLTIVPEAPEEEGHIGVIAQSGSVTESFSYFAKTKGLRFSKMVSYGNAADLDGADFLDYLASDPDTHLIALYVEGTKNGTKLKKALEKATKSKPVIAIKGGLTDQGMRAAASHTASMSSSPNIWRSLFKQTGAIQVENFAEMVNTVCAFSYSHVPNGKAIAIISNSGGFSVIQTDTCAHLGIEVPRFPPSTIASLRKLVPTAGTSISNPLDAWPIFYNIGDNNNIADVIKVCGSAPNIHTLVFHFDQFRYLRRILGPGVKPHMERLSELIVEGLSYVRDVEKKTVLVAVNLDPFLEDEEDRENSLMLKKKFTSFGFPVFSSLDDAIKALSYLLLYKKT